MASDGEKAHWQRQGFSGQSGPGSSGTGDLWQAHRQGQISSDAYLGTNYTGLFGGPSTGTDYIGGSGRGYRRLGNIILIVAAIGFAWPYLVSIPHDLEAKLLYPQCNILKKPSLIVGYERTPTYRSDIPSVYTIIGSCGDNGQELIIDSDPSYKYFNIFGGSFQKRALHGLSWYQQDHPQVAGIAETCDWNVRDGKSYLNFIGEHRKEFDRVNLGLKKNSSLPEILYYSAFRKADGTCSIPPHKEFMFIRD